MDSSKANTPEELSDAGRRVSLKKAADLIGFSYQTTRKLCRDGKLQSFQMGDRYQISLEEIRRFLQYGNYVPPKE